MLAWLLFLVSTLLIHTVNLRTKFFSSVFGLFKVVRCEFFLYICKQCGRVFFLLLLGSNISPGIGFNRVYIHAAATVIDVAQGQLGQAQATP